MGLSGSEGCSRPCSRRVLASVLGHCLGLMGLMGLSGSEIVLDLVLVFVLALVFALVFVLLRSTSFLLICSWLFSVFAFCFHFLVLVFGHPNFMDPLKMVNHS